METKNWISIILAVSIAVISITVGGSLALYQKRIKDMSIDNYKTHLITIKNTAATTQQVIKELYDAVSNLNQEKKDMDNDWLHRKIGRAMGLINSLQFTCDSLLYFEHNISQEDLAKIQRLVNHEEKENK